MGKVIKLEKHVFRFGKHSYAVVVPKAFINIAGTREFIMEIDIDEKTLRLVPKVK